MLTVLLRFCLTLATSLDPRGAHEMTHRICEVAVYAAVAPDVRDDATTPLGEAIADLACRGESTYEACEQGVVDQCVRRAKPDGSTDCLDTALAAEFARECGSSDS